MDNGVDIRTLISVGVIIVGGIVSYYTTLHKLKDYFRDKLEEQAKTINDLKVDIANLKAKDEIQQMTLDQFKKHFLDNLPAFIEILNQKEKKK